VPRVSADESHLHVPVYKVLRAEIVYENSILRHTRYVV